MTRSFVGSAWAAGPAAVTDAVDTAVGRLGAEGPGLVLVFPHVGLGAQDVLTRAHAAAPGALIAGMTSDGVITAAGAVHGGCAAFALSAAVPVGVGCSRPSPDGPRAAGRAAVQEALAGLDVAAGHPVVLLMIDPEDGEEAAIIAGANDVTAGRIPLAGGGANGAGPRLFAHGQAARDTVVAVAIVAPRPVAVGLAHGCLPLGVPAIATRTSGRTVAELDGRAAEHVYLERLGLDPAALDNAAFEAVAVVHPLAQPELNGDVRLRHVQGRGPAGGLRCAASVPPNAAVWFTHQTPSTIVTSARQAVEDVVDALGGPPRAALVFDCAGRKRALGRSAGEEAAAIAAGLPGAELTGIYTRGEVGRAFGAKGDRNHAIVVVGFG